MKYTLEIYKTMDGCERITINPDSLNTAYRIARDILERQIDTLYVNILNADGELIKTV